MEHTLLTPCMLDTAHLGHCTLHTAHCTLHTAHCTLQVYTGEYSVLEPGSFKEAVGASHDQFQGFRQHDCQVYTILYIARLHDCQEFLALLLDSLHEQLSSLGPVRGGAVRPTSQCTRYRLQ